MFILLQTKFERVNKLKAPYSNIIDIFYPRKLYENINTIIKCDI